jgi:hypothetical protein
MLRALGILGTPETHDQRALRGWVPPTPTSPSTTNPRNVDRRVDRRVSDRKNLQGRPATTWREDKMDVAGPSKLPLQITPRRSKRLVDKVELPPTPDSLPSLSPRSGSNNRRARKTSSSSRTRKTRRKIVVPDATPVLIDSEFEGPIGKIHLVQGKHGILPSWDMQYTESQRGCGTIHGGRWLLSTCSTRLQEKQPIQSEKKSFKGGQQLTISQKVFPFSSTWERD